MSLSRTMPLADSKSTWPSRSSLRKAKRCPNSKARWAQRQMKIFGGGLQQISGRRAVRQGKVRRPRRRGRKRSRQAPRRRPRRGMFRGKPHPSQRETSPSLRRTQEERPVRQSERRGEEDRGLLGRFVDELTGREEEPRRGDEPERPRR